MDSISLEIKSETIELADYTDNHFITKLNKDLEKVRKSSIDESNSPISMSNPSSDVEDEDCFDEGLFEPNQMIYKPPGYKKLTFREVRNSINKYYETDDKYSSELDILSTYLKGQKHMFMKASDIIQTKTNWFLIPAGMGSSAITIFAPILEYYKWTGAFISGLNAIIFVLFFFVYYLQWGSSFVVYRQLGNQYERLEHSLDINKLMESESDKSELVLDILIEMEKKLADLKETAIITLPYEMKYIYPILYHIHIFTFIKRIEVYKKNLIVKFKDIKNEIRYIQWKWGQKMELKEKSRFDFLCKIKEKIKNEIIHYKNAYGSMDELMTKEIKRADQMSCSLLVRQVSKRINTDNPVVASYFATIFEDD
jgi:hypothetical protein